MTDVMEWLLDPALPGVRYLALRDLVGLPEDDPKLVKAKKSAHVDGPIAAILSNMNPDGYWRRPGPGYNPKYYSAVWSLITLAQLGASASMDERITRACAYLLEKGLTAQGQFTTDGTSSHTIDCLQGNMCAALTALGYDDPRLDKAFEWMARTVTGEGIAPATDCDAPLRYYAYKCGPLFECGVNNKLACGWGAVKVMLAFSYLPAQRRTPLIKRAIKQGAEYLLSIDPATAQYPTRTGSKPSREWWKFGFPVFYVTDLLQLVEALVGLGYGNDSRLANAIDIICQKQDEQGRWVLEHDYIGKTWVDFGEKKQPNPWITLCAMRVLKKIETPKKIKRE
jgi:hypothetical protein